MLSLSEYFFPLESSSDPVLEEKTATENGVVTPDDGYDGLSKVTVAIPAYTGDSEDIESEVIV